MSNEKFYNLATNEIKYFMCDHCYSYIKGNYNASISFMSIDNLHIYNNTDNVVSIKCPYCEEREMFEIDPYMINPIKALNQKGYYTRFCCEGHVFPKYVDDTTDLEKAIKEDNIDCSIPYIWFDWGRISSQMFYRMIENTKDPYRDYDFFYFDLQREFTLFKTGFIQSKQGLIYVPDGWEEEDMSIYGHDHQIDAIYYRKDDVDKDSLIEKFEDIFSNKEKEDYINDKLMTWVNNLPDLTKIYTKEEFLKAFNI